MRVYFSGLVLTLSLAVLNSDGFAQSPTPVPPAAHIELQGQPLAPDRLLDLPPLPRGQVSLIGGTITRVDPIRDRLVVRAFGGRDVTLAFDVRTTILRGSDPASARDLRPGTRIYADTIWKENQVFAKAIRIETSASLGDSRGQVIDYDAAKGLLKVRDIVSSQPFTLRLSATTDIRSDGQSVPATELVSGTLVHVTFRSGFEGANSCQKIDILARPGSTFTFTGRVVVVDLRDGHLTLAENESDNNFEVALDSISSEVKLRLKEGMDVVVQARFNGRKYEAQSIDPVPAPRYSSPQ
jgi:hypothetical protein